MSGLIADSRTMVDKARVEAQVNSDSESLIRQPLTQALFGLVTQSSFPGTSAETQGYLLSPITAHLIKTANFRP